MKLSHSIRCREAGSTLLAYLFVALAVMATITAIATYVVQNMNFSQRRQDMVNAYQFAQGGAAIACLDVQTAYTNNSGSFTANLGTGGYTKNSALSSSTELVYERTISSPFTNQTVQAQLRMTNSAVPNSAKIFATATVGKVTQTAQVNVEMGFGYGAAIISTAQGTAGTGADKSTAQAGNVSIDGGGTVTTIDGGILANGSVNTNKCVVDDIQEQLYGTGSEIPDYTDPGSPYQLFDFNRFIAVADATGQHYANLSAFIAQAKTTTLEGVIAVDLVYGAKQPSLDSKSLPSGINIRGTLIFNFIPNAKGQNWDPLDKIVNTATMNINAANLSSLVATNPATYPSGYPPTYTDATKKPSYPNIKALYGFDNFSDDDDLPALMYNNAILDIHGNANICGAVYSPSFMEIENKKDGQIQYFRGALIGGGGVLVENGKNATSIVSYDEEALGNLATAGGRGKTVKAVYRK